MRPAGPAPAATRATPAGDTAPNERECDALFAHVVQLAAADQRAAMPQASVTDADVAADQAALRASALAECRTMSRTSYACALAAPSSEQLRACDRSP
jgi:hypothetical protein